MSEWTDIYDEMPPLDKDVMCFVSDDKGFDEMYIGFCWDNPKPRKSKWVCEGYGAVNNEMDSTMVTHWMPLAEPPDHIPDATKKVET